MVNNKLIYILLIKNIYYYNKSFMTENPNNNLNGWTCRSTMEWSPYSCVNGYYYYLNSDTIVYTITFYDKTGNYIENKSTSFLSSRKSWWIRPGNNNSYGAWRADGFTYSPTSSSIVLATRTKTGYTVKWNTQLNGLGTSYNIDETITISSSFNLYEITTPISYTLIYNLDGGSIINNPATVTYDALYDLKIPTKTNYTFNSWYSDSNKITPISTTGTWQLTTVTNLYAKFTINGFNLIYNTNSVGGTGKTFNTVIVGSALTTTSTPVNIPIPRAVGYTFNGWFNASIDGIKKINSDGSGGYTMPASETTLYARWTNNTVIKFSDLQNTYVDIILNRTLLSAYQSKAGKTPRATTSFNNFKGKGPNL